MAHPQRIDGLLKVPVRPFSQGDRGQQPIGYAAAGRQHHRFARIERPFDDVGDAAKAGGVGDAGTSKLVYDPVVHA